MGGWDNGTECLASSRVLFKPESSDFVRTIIPVINFVKQNHISADIPYFCSLTYMLQKREIFIIVISTERMYLSQYDLLYVTNEFRNQLATSPTKLSIPPPQLNNFRVSEEYSLPSEGSGRSL